MLDFFKGILNDADGYPSSKRIISVVLSLLIGLAFAANLIWDFKVDDNILNAVMLIVISGLGISGAEKFVPKTDHLKNK